MKLRLGKYRVNFYVHTPSDLTALEEQEVAVLLKTRIGLLKAKAALQIEIVKLMKDEQDVANKERHG